MKSLFGISFACAMMVAVGSAHATPVNCDPGLGMPNGPGSTADFTISTECRALSPTTGGNPQASAFDDFGLSGVWSEIDKVDLPDDKAGLPALAGENGFISITTNAAGTSGTWSLNDQFFWGSGNYVFVLKQATSNLGFLMLTSNPQENLSGDWSTLSFNPQGISNIQLWGTTDVVPIPLPAAAWMLLSALGGLGFLGWRRKQTV